MTHSDDEIDRFSSGAKPFKKKKEITMKETVKNLKKQKARRKKRKHMSQHHSSLASSVKKVKKSAAEKAQKEFDDLMNRAQEVMKKAIRAAQGRGVVQNRERSGFRHMKKIKKSSRKKLF